jgi:FKBP-type peptidyl-prolyl cis-trans isomerase
MQLIIQVLLAGCLLINSLQSVAASPSLVSNWRLSTKTTVKVFPPTGRAVVSKATEGVEFVTFKSDLKYLSSEWIDRLRIYFSDADGQYLVPVDLTGQWSGTGSAYKVTYDTSVLSLQNKRGKNVNDAFLSRSGYLGFLAQALNYTPVINTAQIVAYSDSGKLTSKGNGLSGTKKIVFLVVWNDPVSSGKLQSEVDVSVVYKGTRITTTSICCGSDATINAADSQAFLTFTGSLPAVTTTNSGLQYIVLQKGNATGSAPLLTDKVTVNYRGMYPSGIIFDSGSLATFNLSGLISGWTEGLQLMKPGDKFRFFIPSSLAYGSTGNATIGPNAALVFDVELVEIITP